MSPTIGKTFFDRLHTNVPSHLWLNAVDHDAKHPLNKSERTYCKQILGFKSKLAMDKYVSIIFINVTHHLLILIIKCYILQIPAKSSISKW